MNLPKYDIFLKNSLQNIWKNEEEKIKNKLSNSELENGKIDLIRRSLKEENFKGIKNKNVICNSCLSIDFVGYRYVCAYCSNFNLCKKCYNLNEHNSEHNFVVIKNPIKEDDIFQYNNKFNPCYEIFQNINKSFEINFMIANTGKKDLNKCYITYIKLTGNYLWCEKFIIKENLLKNENMKIKLKINLKDIKDKKGLFEGHFRMFNEKGIPFGDILKVVVKNENQLL